MKMAEKRRNAPLLLESPITCLIEDEHLPDGQERRRDLGSRALLGLILHPYVLVDFTVVPVTAVGQIHRRLIQEFLSQWNVEKQRESYQ